VSLLMWSMLAAAPPEANVEAALRAVAALSGEPRIVSAAGVTRDETPILTIENADAFDPAATKRRVVLIGGPSGDQRAVVAAVRWFKTRAPRDIRTRWTLSALPLAGFDSSDTQSLSRWIAFQAPDLVVTVGSLPVPTTVPTESIAVPDAIAAFQKLLTTPRDRSLLHATMIARVQRDPLAIARVLARRYPGTPGISYIPAVAWTQTLRLAALTHDDSLRDKVLEQTGPWITGEKPLFGDRVQLTAVAGTMVFAELAAAGDPGGPRQRAARALADQGADLAAAEKGGAVAEYGQGWTDDMFMATSVLAPAGLRDGRAGDLDTAAHRLIEYAARLQRRDGLFNHAVDGPVAWGRGNGFAALGLMEALTRMPASHPARAALLEIFRRQMAEVRTQQAPDGMWRQIIDEPGAYREETATAILMSAMARGIRLGWIDRSYLPAVQRAWRGLAAHIADDGTVIDVCANTGAGPTRRYYFDRPAITGADDRGGAMALLASIEMSELVTRPSSLRRAASSSAARSAR
jgi:unsaturated rhamnogalacturonyl hydrolase